MDQSGAVVPHAQIDLTNSDTGLRRRVLTGNDGSFSLPALPPGRYTLRAVHDGYQITQSQQFSLSVGDKRTLLVRLSLGSVTESVVVSANSAPPANESGALASLTTEWEIADLPSMSREFGDQRTEAFALDNPGTTWNRGGWIAVDGGRNLDNTQTVDGTIVMSQMDGGGGSVLQSGMEGTQEVSVESRRQSGRVPPSLSVQQHYQGRHERLSWKRLLLLQR